MGVTKTKINLQHIETIPITPEIPPSTLGKVIAFAFAVALALAFAFAVAVAVLSVIPEGNLLLPLPLPPPLPFLSIRPAENLPHPSTSAPKP